MTISKKAIEIVRAIAPINNLVAYPLDKKQLVAWSEVIERLAPDVEPGELAFLMDCYATGELTWDKTEGIQNILVKIKRVMKTETGYKLLKPIW